MKHCPHCGGDLGCKARSLPDHKRLFAIIANAHRTWPESHEFSPDSAEHLRGYLICKAGGEWRHAKSIQLPPDADETTREIFVAGIEAALRAADANAYVIPYGSGAAVVTPKSMSFAKLSQQDFGRLRDAITEVIETETGMRVEDLLQEAA